MNEKKKKKFRNWIWEILKMYQWFFFYISMCALVFTHQAEILKEEKKKKKKKLFLVFSREYLYLKN